MNILFYNNQYPDYLLGGVERTTCRLATSLKEKGHKVFCLYVQKYFGAQHCELFDDILFVPEEDVHFREKDIIQFITCNNIEILICQMVWTNSGFMEKIRNNMGCHIVYANHMLPGVEYNWVNYKTHVYPYFFNIFIKSKSLRSFINNVKDAKRRWIYKLKWKESINNKYQEIYNSCERYVVLSESFKSLLADKIGLWDISKVFAIPNMLSYDEFMPIEDLYKKEKVVLIVARMFEQDKRISKALKFWRKIEKDSRFINWSLEIVGDGPSLDSYKRYATENLKRVKFFGKQNPLQFYKRASVFMMTSAAEGFGITLTEAQQFGCVPIVLNTFSVAKDIIDDNKNGILVSSDREYLCRIKRLMYDDEWRIELAQVAIATVHRFDKESVTHMWIDLFEHVCGKE